MGCVLEKAATLNFCLPQDQNGRKGENAPGLDQIRDIRNHAWIQHNREHV